MSAIDPSEARFRDRILKHMKQGPPPVRPPDYGRQSNRLLNELTESIRGEDAAHRGRLDARGQFEAMRGSDLGQALVGDMTADATAVAPDQDVFGAPMLALVSRRLRQSTPLTGSQLARAEAFSARNAEMREQAADELEARAETQTAQQLAAAVAELQEQYPDLTEETALLMLGVGDDDGDDDEGMAA